MVAPIENPKKRQEFLDKARKSESSAAEKFGQEAAKLQGMEKGGKVRATGKRTLHKGEMVARKSCRSKSRGGRR